MKKEISAKSCSVAGGLLVLVALGMGTLTQAADGPQFPYKLPKDRPDMPLSEAMDRLYSQYSAVTPEWSELSSNFSFTRLEGLDYRGGDGTVSRRDPSKIVRVGDHYYVWYTKRDTVIAPQGPDKATDTVPSTDWDLAEIWYATSVDGFTWSEQGVAVTRPAKPAPGWRSVSTPDILVWKEKYYLYYQAFMAISGRRGDDCPVAVSVADSPDGPWRPANQVIIPNGPENSWDQFSIHDPYPLVYRGKIHLYYKSDANGRPLNIRMHGLATADDPLGPFTKHPLNPLMNSGHETTLFPFKTGIAAFAIHNGLEHNTVQYSPDGVNFHVESTATYMPIAAGPYIPDAFTDTAYGRGISWGLSHFTGQGEPRARYSILGRFDCDLSLDVDDPLMKNTAFHIDAEVYFKQGLTKAQRERAEAESRLVSVEK